jgi:putative MATE family efflux protein
MFRDKTYLKTLARIGLPIQYFIMNGMNAIDVMMIGQLGDIRVAGVGLANELFFLLSLMVFGIGSGGAIFAAQYWGKRDIKNLRKVLGVSLIAGIFGASIFTVISLFFGDRVLNIYTKDSSVIAVGQEYLSIAGYTFIPWAISSIYAFILRSTENVRMPMVVSVAAVVIKTGLNYLLIFGNMGLPALGVKGAAISTLLARLLEFSVLILLTYSLKKPAAGSLKEMFQIDFPFLKKFSRTTIPVVFNEVLWSLGITTYTAVYARVGTEAVAAVNIAHTIESMAFVFFMGIGNACAIIVGNKIGAGDDANAFEYGKRSWLIAMLIAGVLGLVLIAVSGSIMSFYNISDISRHYAHIILIFAGLVLWLRASNMVILIGMLRAGGDTRYAFFTEMFSMWAVGVPLAFLSAFVLHLPVYWVYLIVISDEAVKFIIGLRRAYSRRWINNLVAGSSPLPVEALAGD